MQEQRKHFIPYCNIPMFPDSFNWQFPWFLVSGKSSFSSGKHLQLTAPPAKISCYEWHPAVTQSSSNHLLGNLVSTKYLLHEQISL
jgi:hypothetical protein